MQNVKNVVKKVSLHVKVVQLSITAQWICEKWGAVVYKIKWQKKSFLWGCTLFFFIFLLNHAANCYF